MSFFFFLFGALLTTFDVLRAHATILKNRRFRERRLSAVIRSMFRSNSLDLSSIPRRVFSDAQKNNVRYIFWRARL